MTDRTKTQRRNLIAVALRTAAFLREYCARDGVPRLGDFLNGMVTASCGLEQRLEGDSDFVSILKEEIERADDLRESESFRVYRGQLGHRAIGEVFAEKSNLSLIASVAAEGKFIEVANEIRVNKTVMLRMMAMAIVATVIDASEESDCKEHLDVVLWSAKERADAGRMVSELSDAELFGDF